MFSAEGLECGCDDASPDTGSELTALKNVLMPKLDVIDEASIATAVAAAEERFWGSIGRRVQRWVWRRRQLCRSDRR